jgi:hypothetical protein
VAADCVGLNDVQQLPRTGQINSMFGYGLMISRALTINASAGIGLP